MYVNAIYVIKDSDSYYMMLFFPAFNILAERQDVTLYDLLTIDQSKDKYKGYALCTLNNSASTAIIPGSSPIDRENVQVCVSVELKVIRASLINYTDINLLCAIFFSYKTLQHIRILTGFMIKLSQGESYELDRYLK